MGKNNNKNKKKKKSRKGELKDDANLLEGISNIDISDASDNINKCMEISDEELFKEPPPKEDCPICLLPIPFANGLCDIYTAYQACCGQTLCMGCNLATVEGAFKGELKHVCAFCRTPTAISNEVYIGLYLEMLEAC